LAASAVLVVMPLPIPAAAFPAWETIYTCGPSVSYSFENPDGLSAWTAAEKTEVELGAEGWESTLDWDGTLVATIFEASGSEIDVWFEEDFAGSPTLGEGDCNRPAPSPNFSLRLNPDLRSDFPTLRVVARHEMGHVLGLDHTGWYDDYTSGSTYPTSTRATLTTCLAYADVDNAIYGQDDAAALTHQLGGLDPESIHPNAGYEDWSSGSPRYWAKTGGVWSQSSVGTADGTFHLRYKPSSSDSSYAYQTVNYADGTLSGAVPIDARVNYKKDVSTDTGSIRLELLVRQKTYGTSGNCLSQFFTGVNQNVVVSTGSWIEVRDSGLLTVSSSWALYTTSSYTISAAWHAADIRVAVKSTVRNSAGALTYVRLDTVRARDRK